MVTAGTILQRLRDDGRALPRLVTLVENEDPRGLDALDALFPLTGNAHVIGVTGPPGAGKSTLIAALIERIRDSGQRVAVLAVDPSSTLTGGAVLGDRIRMMARHADPGVFMRSMASRGRQGGLAWATAELVHLFDAAGFPKILVETIGTGQDGTDVASLADTVVVVQAPGLGDGVQAIKSGLLEVGDVVVVNKADLSGAEDTIRVLRTALALGQPNCGRAVPVIGTNSISGDGVAGLLSALDEHRDWLDESGDLASRRARGARAEILAGLRATLERDMVRHPEKSPELVDAITRVMRRELTPRRAIELLAAPLRAGPRDHTRGAIRD